MGTVDKAQGVRLALEAGRTFPTSRLTTIRSGACHDIERLRVIRPESFVQTAKCELDQAFGTVPTILAPRILLWPPISDPFQVPLMIPIDHGLPLLEASR